MKIVEHFIMIMSQFFEIRDTVFQIHARINGYLSQGEEIRLVNGEALHQQEEENARRCVYTHNMDCPLPRLEGPLGSKSYMNDLAAFPVFRSSS